MHADNPSVRDEQIMDALYRNNNEVPRLYYRDPARVFGVFCDSDHTLSLLVVDLLRIVALERPFEKLALFLDAK
jgi:hypothetical protein